MIDEFKGFTSYKVPESDSSDPAPWQWIKKRLSQILKVGYRSKVKVTTMQDGGKSLRVILFAIPGQGPVTNCEAGYPYDFEGEWLRKNFEHQFKTVRN